MKIAVSSTGRELTSQVEPRFGRSPYFVLIDPETRQFETIENPNVNAMGGAGIQTAQLVANNGIEVVLTGSCGPNAFQILQAAGVKVIIGVVGTINDAVERYTSGQYTPTSNPNVASHFGVRSGFPANNPGFGRGSGMGRGRNVGMRTRMGRGRGVAYGFGPGQQPQTSPSGFPQHTPEQELQMLRRRAEELKQQFDEIIQRIRELEHENR